MALENENKDYYSVKEENYFGLVRTEIIDLVPKGVKTVLEVGCGEGATAAEIKRKFNCEVSGIELFESAVQKAEKLLDRVIWADIENYEPDFQPYYFDCIIFADILEHTKDPWAVLNKYKKYLNKEGWIIASIPNIRYIVPVLKILTDKFEYEPSGILDQTHLRFFTLHTIKKMFDECGYRIINISENRNNGWKMKLLSLLSFGLLKSFGVVQYLIVAKAEK